MFPTFTGSSKRRAVVNLSGQNTNPFSNAWSPATSSGPSRTVADAQAERRLRQQDRERLKAAQDLQRVWRGHRIRRNLRDSRREIFDTLYAPAAGASSEPIQRIPKAFPLLLSFFEVRRDGDLARLVRFSHDLEQEAFVPLLSGQLAAARLGRLAHIAILATQQTKPVQTPPVLLRLLIEMVSHQPRTLVRRFDTYFDLLGKYCQVEGADAEAKSLLRTAISAPLLLRGPFQQHGYEMLIEFFLTQALDVFQQDIATIGRDIDIHLLSSCLLSLSLEKSPKWSEEGLFWLLAHLIALQAAQPRKSPLFLRALHKLLSILSVDVRQRYPAQQAGETSQEAKSADNIPELPPYVVAQLGMLVSRQQITQLLGRFVVNPELEDAGFVSSYLLTLIWCFPTEADAIRMRLYLLDAEGFLDAEGRSHTKPLPAVKVLWSVVRSTKVWLHVSYLADSRCFDFLQRSKPLDFPHWDQEWETALLFLDLYAFVLRLTDDEDFFSTLDPTATGTPSSRVRLCALEPNDLQHLAMGLRNLSFTLIENWAYFSAEQNSIVPGVGPTAFKDIVSTALRMLYERDSRRSFLKEGAWLMRSDDETKDFLQAVILEEERQHEMRENGSDSEEEDHDDSGTQLSEYTAVASNSGARRRQQLAWLEHNRAQRKAAFRDRQRAILAPKLEILRQMPYTIPFEERVGVFRQFVHLDQHRRRNGYIDPDQWRVQIVADHGNPLEPSPMAREILGRHHARIGRGKLFEDAFAELYNLGEGLKEPMQITFVDKFGEEEAGIDGGGVTKEFLTSVTSEAFSDDHLLFVANKRNAFYPNPLAVDQVRENRARSYSVAQLLERFEFLGRVVGKCLYEGILLDIAFAGFFLLKWSTPPTETGYRVSINDLRDMDEELYQGLLSLKHSTVDVASLDLDFTVNDQVSLPGDPVRTVTRELIPNGGQVRVTNENRPLYTSYVARHRLAGQPYRQTVAFLQGLGTIIDPAWLAMFNQNELQRLVGGDSSDINVEDLRANTRYSGVFEIGSDGKEHDTIQLFWQVMHEMADSERRDVLKYVTSTPRAPLLGFSQLNPPFSIRDSGGDEKRLPSASTCVNLLKLPRYKDAATLKGKLLYAVSSNAGFDLS